MNTKIVAGMIAGVVVIVAAVVMLRTPSSSTYIDRTTSAPHETTNPNTDSTGSATTSSSGSGSTASNFTMAQVALHAGASSCWAAVNGKVYDLTKWINQHPGGQDKILGLCGKDGSSAFNGQHGGEARPASELNSFYIGVLAR